MSKADFLDFQIKLYNPGSVPLSNFTMDFRAYTIDGLGHEVDEPELSGTATLPPGFTAEPGEEAIVDLRISSTINAPDEANVEYTFTSAEGAVTVFYGLVTMAEAIPVISVKQPVSGYVDVSVNRGSLVTVQVKITNVGLRTLENTELTLPENITWMTSNLLLNAQNKVLLGNIGVGESRSFDVVFVPPADLDFGHYNDVMVVSGSNSPQEVNINLFALVTSDQTGTVSFAVTNLFAQTVEGASIRMNNYAINESIGPIKTNINGEAEISGLQEGEWSYQVVASGHTSARGTITVVPGQIILEEVELIRSLVTIEFTVVPVPFTDRYEIVIEQTFVTNVPVPVLVIEPPSVNFYDVLPGFETTVVAKLSNYGLIDLRDINLSSDYSDVASSVPLISYIPRLHAMQTIEIPFKVTYWGRSGTALPPGGSGGSCMSDCMGSDLYNMDDFKTGLANIIDGSSVSELTKAAAKAAVNLLLYIHEKKGKPSFDGDEAFADIFKWVGCQIGCASESGDWGKYIGPDPEPLTPYYGPKTDPGEGVGCFTMGTPILMVDGSQKTIEEISIGDEVMTFDGEAGRVSQIYQQKSDHVRELRYRIVNDEDTDNSELHRLRTTDEHLFWVLEPNSWVAAQNLEVGNVFMTANGARAELIETTRFKDTVDVYNFDVDNYYSYFANGVLVRQRCGDDPEIGIEMRIIEFLESQDHMGLSCSPNEKNMINVVFAEESKR